MKKPILIALGLMLAAPIMATAASANPHHGWGHHGWSRHGWTHHAWRPHHRHWDRGHHYGWDRHPQPPHPRFPG